MAVEVVDRLGPDALTLKAIADAAGVRPPSLYNHVDGLEDVRLGLRLRAYEFIAVRQHAATEGLPPRAWLRALARAHRTFALEHPGLYAAMQPTVHTPDVDPELRRAAEAVLDQLITAVAALGTTGDDAVHAVRALRSAVLGFITLEIAGDFGMPQDIDQSFEQLIEVLERGIAGREQT